jgi:hypothetical protein
MGTLQRGGLPSSSDLKGVTQTTGPKNSVWKALLDEGLAPSMAITVGS